MSAAPSSTLMRAVEMSPWTEPSARMSTRSLHSMLPVTLPMTTTSRAWMLASTLAVAADGDAAIGHRDFAFDAAVDVEGFGAADLALDDQSAADGGLIYGSSDVFGWGYMRWGWKPGSRTWD